MVNLYSSEGAVAEATVVDVAHVVSSVRCVDNESRLELCKVEGGFRVFFAGAVKEASPCDDLADVLVNELALLKVSVGAEACAPVRRGEGGRWSGMVGLKLVVCAVLPRVSAFHEHCLVLRTVELSICRV